MLSKEPDSEPITRKEVIEYLRNVQKATEVRSRLSGINIWVLLGAIGFVVWSLLDEKNPPVSDKIILFTLAACEILVLIFLLQGALQFSGRASDIRFLPEWVNDKSHLSKFWCALFLWYAAPYLASGLHNGFTAMSVAMPLMMAFGIYREIFVGKDDLHLNLPGPRTEWITGVLILLSFLVLTIWENRRAADFALELNRGEVRQCALAAVLYFLVALLISRSLENKLDFWTYQLERQLILGTCTIQEALEKIENHSIGARLQNVIDKRRGYVKSRESEIEQLLGAAEVGVGEIELISEKYIHERRAQLATLSNPILAKIEDFDLVVREVEVFRGRLENRSKLVKDTQIMELSESLRREISEWHEHGSLFRSRVARLEDRLMAGNGI